MQGRARARAEAVLDTNVELFRRLGYREAGRPAPLEVRLEVPSGMPLVLRMAPQGRIFGGTFALEIGTAEPILPPSRGLSARGRGVVRLSGFAFRPRRGDEHGAQLARTLAADPGLTEALKEVHFERIRVEADGRAVIRHMGGSVVWFLFPPMIRPIPLVEAQARATAQALAAFARVGSV